MGHLRKAFVAATATVMYAAGAHAAPPTAPATYQTIAPTGQIFSGDFSGQGDHVIEDALAARSASRFTNTDAPGAAAPDVKKAPVVKAALAAPKPPGK